MGHTVEPLQFEYREHLGLEDAVLYKLHRVYSHLDDSSSYVTIIFFDFSIAFNTIRHSLLEVRLEKMSMDPSVTCWIIDYLTRRPQFVRLRNCVSDKVVSSTAGSTAGSAGDCSGSLPVHPVLDRICVQLQILLHPEVFE